MKIKNFAQLATTDARNRVLEIAEAGLEAIDTEKVLKDLVSVGDGTLGIGADVFPIPATGRIFFVGVGKCALEAGAVFEGILGDRLEGGVVIDVKSGMMLKKLTSFKGSHPFPSDENTRAARAVVDLLRGMREDDLVIFSISGGGSTLLCLSENGSCAEEMSVIQALMRAGATIEEMNTVRKHLSLARGGYLAYDAYPAQVISLIFSDVPGNDISFIASGPTVKDATTIADAESVLARYDILKACGIVKCGLIETPKEEKYFERVHNILALSNETALGAMTAKAGELGLKAKIVGTQRAGEAAVVAKAVCDAIHAEPAGSVLLWGGETTVTVRGDTGGHGGRNLELSATALGYITEGETVLSLASDGKDNGPYAGALCDTITKKAVADAGLSLAVFLDNHNTYPLFEKIGNYIDTGDTGSNVSDLIIALKREQ